MLLGFRRERYVLSQQTINHAQASLNAIEQNGTMSQIAFARFNLGMAYLWYGWHGKLEDAEFHMKIAQTEAEDSKEDGNGPSGAVQVGRPDQFAVAAPLSGSGAHRH